MRRQHDFFVWFPSSHRALALNSGPTAETPPGRIARIANPTIVGRMGEDLTILEGILVSSSQVSLLLTAHANAQNNKRATCLSSPPTHVLKTDYRASLPTTTTALHCYSYKLTPIPHLFRPSRLPPPSSRRSGHKISPPPPPRLLSGEEVLNCQHM